MVWKEGDMLIRLNSRQLARLDDWIAAKGVRRECSGCGKDDWDVRGCMAAHQYYRAAVPGPGRAEPLILIICKNCSQARLFGGELIGIS
jgi:hypothetical protein